MNLRLLILFIFVSININMYMSMKKIVSVLMVAVALMMAAPAQAQLIKFGLKGGLNFAELDLNVLVQPVTLLLGVIYIIARSAGKYLGSGLSCRLTRQPKPIVDNLGITLLPQAGVALGMCATAARVMGPEGTLIRNIILFSVLVYELVGPSLTKMALTKAGDIQGKSDELKTRRTRRLKEIRKKVPEKFNR